MSKGERACLLLLLPFNQRWFYCLALELVLTARVFKAKDEQASGLFNYVVPQNQVLPKALAIAKEIGLSAHLPAPGLLLKDRYFIQLPGPQPFPLRSPRPCCGTITLRPSRPTSPSQRPSFGQGQASLFPCSLFAVRWQGG